MSLHKNSYLGHSAGIHSIQEKDDILEQDGHEPNLNGYDVGENAHASKISNHYEVPNMSSMLYEFTNKEADRIH